MDISSRINDPLQWSEGMLLTPQHFQQNDIYWHGMMRHQLAQAQPYYWGVVSLRLDEERLREGRVHIEELHCVMPDGLVVQYPASGQEQVLSLDIGDYAQMSEHRPLKVYLAVPVRAEGAASPSSAIQRYDSVSGDLEIDENTGEGRAPVERLRPCMRLLAGDDIPAKYLTVPLLEVVRDQGGQFELSAFHPPMVRMGAAAFLGESALQQRLRLLTQGIRAKAKELAGAVGEGADSNPISVSPQHQHLIRQLTAALPPLEVLVRAEAHPFEVYMALAHLVGQMSSLGSGGVPLMLEPYKHDDLAPGFLIALQHLQQRLDRIRIAYEALPFERVEDAVFTRALAPDSAVDRLIVELKPRAGESRVGLIEWMQQARIGTDTLMPLLRQRRLPGARVRLLQPDDLAELNLQGTGALFEIVNQNVEWKDQEVPTIRAGKLLQIEGHSDVQLPAAIVLYQARLPAASAGAVPDGESSDG